jgi:hypothetical protein
VLSCSQNLVYCASASHLAVASESPVLEISDVPFLDCRGWLVVVGCAPCACVVLPLPLPRTRFLTTLLTVVNA